MAKPSMFSYDYGKKMRRRRMIRTVVILLVVTLPVGALIYKTSVRGVKLALIERQEQKDLEAKKTEENKNKVIDNHNEQESKKETENKADEKVVVNDKLNVTLIIKEENGKKVISDVITDGNLYKNISPNKEKVVILDKEQNMFIIDNEKKVENITYKEYIGPDKTSYTKDSTLKKNTNYIWGKDPVFINDDTIAYMSQLPWFGKEEQYLWLYSLKDKKYTPQYKTFGKQVSYQGMKDDGFEIKMDNKIILIKKDGTVTSR